MVETYVFGEDREEAREREEGKSKAPPIPRGEPDAANPQVGLAKQGNAGIALFPRRDPSLDSTNAYVKPWYKEGLKFKCTECGKCCTGAPGYVWVKEEEIAELSTFLKITPAEFKRKYTRSVHGRTALIEKSVSYDCVFLKDKLCQVYQVRPQQCRTFPWWKQLLQSEKAWKEASSYCEGIDHPEGVVLSCEEIEKYDT